jgi:hypothetical protein
MPNLSKIENDQPSSVLNRRLMIEGIGLGTAYGLFLRACLGNHMFSNWINAHDEYHLSGIMTVGFLFAGPFAMGFLTVARAETRTQLSVWKLIFAPWLTVFVMMLAAALFAWEGAICIAMATPIALLLASFGGAAAGAYRRIRKISRATVTCVALLPFLAAITETRLAAPDQIRTVSSQIRIHASPQIVWENIERVPAIAPSELNLNWTHRLGFPRPIEATLSYEGVGGVRHASFEHGLLFIETINVWEPMHRLAFSIKADAAHIPPSTLDEHVTIGGPYFDVLNGEYQLEPQLNGDVVLYLTSRQRLSTSFNSYAGLWTEAVMQNIQTSILQVIRHRCEQT